MDKKEIRNRMKLLKEKLKQEEINHCSINIYHKLITMIDFAKYDAIYTYVAFNEEIQTDSVIGYAIQNKIKVAVPKIIDKEMKFYYINGLEDLKMGYYGILEPTTNILACDNHILMIMPGLAFDLDCNRIGYGGGYYDKYLNENKLKQIHKIAFAYDFQIVEELRTEEYDIKVDQIITTTRCIERGE